MKKIFAVIACLLATYSANSAFAATDVNKTIVKIGVQNNVAYIVVSPALTIGPAGFCQFDLIYLGDTSTSSGKALYATLLTAYSQGKPLSRVDYFNAGTGTPCFINLIEVS